MKTIFTCLLVSVALLASAQQNTFKVRSFASGYSYLNQITQLNDGSFVGVGTFYGNSNSDTLEGVYLLKTDVTGNVLASKEISISGLYDDGLSIAKTSDGGFVVCSSSITETIALIKYKADLSIVWQKEYAVTNVQLVANKVIQTTDDGYMIAGFVFAYRALDIMPTGGSIIKTDESGNVQFAKQYFGTPDKVFSDLATTTDGNYALLGNGTDSSFIVKVNPQGTILWSKVIYDNDVQNTSDVLWALAAVSDGGIVITGESYKLDTNTNSTGDDKMIMVKYNAAGALQWSKKLATGKETANYGLSVTEDKDGGMCLQGAWILTAIITMIPIMPMP